jgi:hypothetical protein
VTERGADGTHGQETATRDRVAGSLRSSR